MIDICRKEKCIGCEVCRNVCPRDCISFEQDNEGFFIPVIDSTKCVGCNLCQKHCPANCEPEYHSKPKIVYAAWALDNEIRQSSSSGGLYSVFANSILEQGGSANGVYLNDEHYVVHGLFHDQEAIKRCRGSKYVQSRPGYIYRAVKDALELGEKVFFTSTPCQVYALYKYLGKDYKNLYTCDFICHGVPSPEYFKDCLCKITDGDKDFFKVIFRDLSGWGRYQIKVAGKEKEYSEEKINNVYTKTFLSGVNYRHACYTCPFARSSRVADITIGDFWGVGRYFPFLHDVSKGVSLLVINTQKGEEIIKNAGKQIRIVKRTFREAARYNHQLRNNVNKPQNRDDFYSDVLSLSCQELIKKYEMPINVWKKWLDYPMLICSAVLQKCIKWCCKLTGKG